MVPQTVPADKNGDGLRQPRSLSEQVPVGWWFTSAEGVGFEPTVGVSPQRFSRPSDSATLASLQELLTCLFFSSSA